MKWLEWFKAHPEEEERYKMFRARFQYEAEQQRAYAAAIEEKLHNEAMEDAMGWHGQG